MKCPKCKLELEYVCTEQKECAWICSKCDYLKEDDTDRHEELNEQQEHEEENMTLSEEAHELSVMGGDE